MRDLAGRVDERREQSAIPSRAPAGCGSDRARIDELLQSPQLATRFAAEMRLRNLAGL